MNWLVIVTLIVGQGITTMSPPHLDNPRIIRRIVQPFEGAEDFGRLPSLQTMPPDTQWQVVDRKDLFLLMWPGERIILDIDSTGLTLTDYPDTGLTANALQAIDISPDWLRPLLADNMHRLTPEFQDIYAQMIINPTDDRYRDEIAFVVAALSPEILMDSVFDPQLVEVNAEYIYQNADSLDYVELVEDTTGEDYFTTARYRYIDANGDTAYTTIPYWIYYYYIVHPELSDEMPRMDEYVYNRFWRDFLFYYADPGYPRLADVMRGVKTLWVVSDTPVNLPRFRPFDSTSYALDIVGNWVGYNIPTTATGDRPIQPNVIIHEHNGNCGELQDALVAGARTALIPITSHFTLAEDHVFTAFYFNGNWYPYQVGWYGGPTSINAPGIAMDDDYGGGKHISSVLDWRSDGYTTTMTHLYSDVCSLHVQVVDWRNKPVPGARVLLYTEGWYGGYSVSSWLFTDQNGIANFEIGELRNFYIHVNSPIGDYPEDPNTIVQIIENSQTGAQYYVTVTIPNFTPSPWADTTGGDETAYMVEITTDGGIGVEHGYVRCRRNAGDVGFYHTYGNLIGEEQVRLDYYVMDSSNFEEYQMGHRFTAASMAEDIPITEQAYLTMPEGRWKLLISNEDGMTTTKYTWAHIVLYRLLPSVEEDEPIAAHKLPRLDVALSNSSVRLTAFAPDEGYQLNILDITGRLVNTLRLNRGSNVTTLPVNGFASGVYFARLVSASGNSQVTKKFMIVR